MDKKTTKKAAAPKKAVLSLEEKEAIAEEVLGVHPKFLLQEGICLKVDVYAVAAAGKQFTGWKFVEHFHR